MLVGAVFLAFQWHYQAHVPVCDWVLEIAGGYGLRDVPPENEGYAAKLFEMIRSGAFSLDTGTVSHIEGYWLYFEGLG